MAPTRNSSCGQRRTELSFFLTCDDAWKNKGKHKQKYPKNSSLKQVKRTKDKKKKKQKSRQNHVEWMSVLGHNLSQRECVSGTVKHAVDR